MNEYQQHVDDEISLKELITAILAGWKMIVAITVIATLLGGIYAFVISDTVYESHQRGIISIPESTSTHFGTYVYPSTNKLDYLEQMTSDETLLTVINQLGLETSLNSFRSSISVSTEKDRNTFEVTLKAPTAQEAQIQLNALTTTYYDAIMQDYKEKARAFFMRDYYVQINRTTESLKVEKEKLSNYETVIETVEPTISLQKLVLSNPTLAAEMARERGATIETLTGEMMLEEVVNPNYYDLEKVILEQKKIIADIETTLNHIKDQYTLLESNHLEEGMLEIMRSKIVFSGSASLPENPIAPRKIFILAISIVLGLMLGVFVALFQSYWINAE